MAFVRAKTTAAGKQFFYLVESYREGGKVRQRILAYLGECDTIEGAIAELEARADRYRGYAARARHTAEHPEGWRQYRRRETIRAYADKWDKRIAELERRIEKLRSFV